MLVESLCMHHFLNLRDAITGLPAVNGNADLVKSLVVQQHIKDTLTRLKDAKYIIDLGFSNNLEFQDDI